MNKKILTLLVISLFFVGIAQAQGTIYYTFSESSGTFTSINTTGTAVTPDDWDDGKYFLDLSGSFTLFYNRVNYSTFGIGTNGAIILADLEVPHTNNLTEITPTIAPLWDDMDFENDGVGDGLFYQIEGIAGSQILTVEWYNTTQYSDIGQTVSFQTKLYEATGVIEFIYGDMSNATNWVGESASIGINANADGVVFMSVTPGTPATISTSTANNSIDGDLVSAIISGTTYTFTPTPQLANDASITEIITPIDNFTYGTTDIQTSKQYAPKTG